MILSGHRRADSRLFRGETAVVLVVLVVAFGTLFGVTAVLRNTMEAVSHGNTHRQPARTLSDLQRAWSD